VRHDVNEPGNPLLFQRFVDCQTKRRGGPVNPGSPRSGRGSVQASVGELQCGAELVAEVENGTYVVSEVRCARTRGGPEVTGEAIRAVPIHRILTARAIDANGGLHPGPGVAKIRDQDPTEDSLHVVAYAYRLAHMVRDPPTRVVASAIGLPYSRPLARSSRLAAPGSCDLPTRVDPASEN
jgi:hypothetical protein